MLIALSQLVTLILVCLGPFLLVLSGRATHSNPFLSILVETIDYVVALDPMELGIKIVIFKEVDPPLDWQHLVFPMETQRILHNDAAPILAVSRSFFH